MKKHFFQLLIYNSRRLYNNNNLNYFFIFIIIRLVVYFFVLLLIFVINEIILPTEYSFLFTFVVAVGGELISIQDTHNVQTQRDLSVVAKQASLAQL